MKTADLKIGIDLGSRFVKIVVTQSSLGGKNNIIGATKEKMDGIIAGHISVFEEALTALKKAIRKTEKVLEVEIKKAHLGLSLSSVKHTQFKIKTIVAKSSNEISTLDLEKSREECQKTVELNNSLQILHISPAYIFLDGKRVKGNPIGMIGHNLEITYLVSVIPKKALEDILSLFEQLDIEIVEVHHNCFLSSIPLTKSSERIFGIATLDIGADTSLFTMYENDLPVLSKVFNLGGNSFTRDISIMLVINIEEAETAKKNYKLLESKSSFSKDEKKIINIIDARIDDFVDLITKETEKIKKVSQIPNGIILTGGGSNLHSVREKFKQKLRLPILEAKEILRNNTEGILTDATWTNAYALTFFDFEDKSFFAQLLEPVIHFLKDIFRKVVP